MSGIKKFFGKTIVILGIILIVATFLRFYRITVDPPSLFGDELDLGYQAYSILKTGKDYQGNFLPIHFHSLAEWRTPLYLYSAVPTVAIWGITPFGVRVPAALFGVLGILAFYLLVKELTKNEKLALLSAVLLTISPWDLQYSRAGFEVTEMLFFLITGLWLFYKGINEKTGKYLWISVICFTLTPWIYSTAKLYTPILLIFLLALHFKEIFSFSRKYLIYAVIAGFIVGVPIAYSTLFGGGSQRFNYINIFADPQTDNTVGTERELAARIRGESGAGLVPTFFDRVIYNKFTYWGENFLNNYLGAFSTNFLFVQGDIDLRQSTGSGELYRIEIIALVAGLIFFFSSKEFNKKIKALFAFLLIVGPVPSAITVGGGGHATRLILLLPPLMFLVAYGWFEIINRLKKFKLVVPSLIIVLYAISMFFYFNDYYTVYPWRSERLWHYGWGPAITEVKNIQSHYDRVFISMSNEPAWIFFAGWYQYPPKLWQSQYPIGNDVNVQGFGQISHTGKFYFGSPDKSVQIYGIGRYLTTKDLYVANASEVAQNLIMDPKSVPIGLNLIKIIPFPSGEPAFYLFAGTK